VSETTPTRTDGPPGTSDGPPGDGGAPQDRRRKRLASYTVRNMVYSMLLMLLVVLAWWSTTSNPTEPQRRPPEVAQTATFVAEQARWPVWVPEPGDGWTPTVVWFDSRIEGVETWHISFVSPEGEYVALHQAADVTDEWVAEVLAQARPTGAHVTLPGPGGERTWQAWEGPDGGNAEAGYLLGPQATGGSSVAVHGTAGQTELEAFLRSVTARD
jgi:hypothetical protein